MAAIRRYLPILLAILGALGVTVAITSGPNGTEIHAHLPRYGHVPPKGSDALERQVKAARKAANEGVPGKPGCDLTPHEARVDARGVFDHEMGDCAPDVETKASTTGHGSRLGCDRSNHNPIYSVDTWRHVRRLGFSYCWDKTSEAGGSHAYRDPTVGPMSAAQARAGVVPGGYHFAHVCMTSPDAEGQVFVEQLRRFDLVGPDRLRPALDVEYGGCSTQSGTRAWIAALRSYVVNATHAEVVVYTGGWWSNPHAGCLFCALPKDVLAWISGYPNAPTIAGKSCPAGQNDVHQYTSSGDGGLSGDINRLECGTAFGELAAARRQAPPEAQHQCRMHNHYAAWFRKYTQRQIELHKQGRELGESGAARLKSATDHLVRIRHYFVKDHEHGTVNYDCGPDGVAVARAVHPKPTPEPKPHPHSTEGYRVIQGSPANALIAPYIDIVSDEAAVNSIDRSEAVAAILHAHGKHTQGELYACWVQRMPGCAPANPPGRSTHERRCDGVAYGCSPVGGELDWWQQGFDVNDSDVPKVIAHAHRLGWVIFQPYQSGVEFHHLNFLYRPAPNGHVSAAKIRARRARLPTR